ncbi:unnamed protein product [Echinostoma caproni]|uniref:Protein-tyrosine-phosphatase n=1 Tax=Echinostoma caproni TaxID=27848 RepID=A0A183A947_9TREM|nr:unnamed protein product [Echinostoma caproni]
MFALSDFLFDPFESVGTGHLHIRELRAEDAGLYECRVVQSSSVYVVLRSSIALAVGQAPQLIGPMSHSVSGHIQAERNMSCAFVAQPEALFEWVKNSEPVKHSQYFRIRPLMTTGPSGQSGEPTRGMNQSGWPLRGTELSIRGLLPNDEGYFQCFAINRFGSAQVTYTLRVDGPFLIGFRTPDGDDQHPVLMAPSHATVQALSDTQAYITWTPPDPTLGTDSLSPNGYMIRLTTPGSSHGLTLNTTKPALLLTDLRADSTYNVEVFTVNLADGRHSSDSAPVHFRTKPPLYRPIAVTDLAADAGEFRTLILSWKPPLKSNLPLSPLDEISNYRTDRREEQAKPLLITIPTTELRRRGDRLSYTVSDLTPDTFYQVSVQAVTKKNVTGYPAVLSSSARVASRPPSKAPTQVRVQAIGARVATVTWQPPPEGSRNGELILYRINISCEDWLRPRQINVLNVMSQLIRGLSRGTKYELTVSAATRGGNGPDSALVAFTTMNEENVADRDAAQTDKGYFLRGDEDLSSYSTTHSKTPLTDVKSSSQLRAVENLRTIEDERSILILWSPSATGRQKDGQASPELDRYMIKWGKLYPGPQSATVGANQTRFLIDNLEANTPYMIEVSVYNKNQEAASAMITGRTKPALFRHRLLIPLNLQVTSVDPDGAVVMWDEPICSAQSAETSNSADCLSKELIQYYQVAYRMIGFKEEKSVTLDENEESEEDEMSEEPGDAPHDVSLTALPFPPGDGPVSVQVSWQPPLRPHGRLVGYVLYYTADRQLPLSQWSKRRLPADSLNTVLSGLSRGLIYFVQLSARNEHGNGPLSPIRLYRTPDAFGQGGGRIPLGRIYHNATSIPSEFLTFGQSVFDHSSMTPIKSGNAQSEENVGGTRANNTPMMAVGSVVGLGLISLATILIVFWWRRQRRPFVPVLGYKPPGSHMDGLANTDGLRSLSKTGSIGSHGTKRARGAYPNQDIALLMSNGEALNAADPCSPQTLSVQPHTTLMVRQGPNDQLTTSVQLSTGGTRPVNVSNASHAALLQQQLQQHNRTPSWDRDSDSLQFASVSQQRQADGALVPGLFDLHPSNNTPTRTGSASTNSGPGSVCTPTRITGNLNYQPHATAGFPPETTMAYSYASASLGATPGTAPLILPRSPMNQYQLGTGPGYMSGMVNGAAAAAAAAAAAVSSSGGLLISSYYPTSMAYQTMHAATVPGQSMFYPNAGPPAVVGEVHRLNCTLQGSHSNLVVVVMIVVADGIYAIQVVKGKL